MLVTEDDKDIQTAIAEYLRGEGFEVDVADDGREALRIAHAGPPDVLVLDAMLPVMNARAVLAEWLQDPVLSLIPVLLVSAGRDLPEIAQQFGVRATLAKPFDLDVLCAVVEQILAHPEPAADTPTVEAPAE